MLEPLVEEETVRPSLSSASLLRGAGLAPLFASNPSILKGSPLLLGGLLAVMIRSGANLLVLLRTLV